MSVTTAPGAAAAGFDVNTGVGQLLLNGTTITADVTEAISEAVLDRTMVGSSTLTLTVEDPFAVLVNNPLFTQTTVCTIVGDNEILHFTLVQIQKQGYQLTLTFEDSSINSLRNVTADEADYFMMTSGTGTRGDFAAKLIAKTGLPILLQYPPDGSPYAGQIEETLGWGTTDSPTEDAWTCLTRVANEVQWRCFSDGSALWFGPDEWLLQFPKIGPFVQNTGGVDSIDFDWDSGKATATAVINCVATVVTFPPGQPAVLADLGVANGTWLVSDTSRSLFFPDATVDLVQAQPEISESDAVALSTGAIPNTSLGTAAGNNTGSNGGVGVPAQASGANVPNVGESAAAQKAVEFALAQVGKPYVYGATGPGSYDCSGLMQTAYRNAGVSIPRTSEAQYQGLPSAPLGNLLPGDLIFTEWGEDFPGLPGHVGMYVGDGTVVQAPHTGTNVGTISYTSFTAGQQVAAARPT